MNFGDWLKHFFLPHESNNQKAKALHLSSLIFLLILVGSFQLGLVALQWLKPGVLGFASNISPERLVQLTNERRAEQGLAPLNINPLLVKAARQKGSEMFTFGCWSHNCNGRTPWWFINNVGYDYLYAGENLAKDFADSEAVVDAWMNSPTHRDNILNPKYKEIGIAVIDGVLNGEETTLVVQMFGTPVKKTPTIAYAQQTNSLPKNLPLPSPSTEKVVPSPQPLKEDSSAENQASFSATGFSSIFTQEPTIPANLEKSKQPISPLALTKIFYLFLVSLLIIILFLDLVIVSRNQIVRISGKSLIHLSFFIIILISILLTNPGVIL